MNPSTAVTSAWTYVKDGSIQARNFAPDLVRACAIVLVVLLHASMRGVGLTGFAWWSSTILHSLTRIGVPLFFLLSGWLLLTPTHAGKPGAFLFRRLRKVVIPFIAWSAFWLVWRFNFQGEETPAWPALFKSLFNGSAYYHLWFFPVIIKAYLAAPVLYWWHAYLGTRWYAVSLAAFGVLFILVRWTIPAAENWSRLYVFFSYCGYFALGGIIGDIKLGNSSRMLAWLGVFIGWSATVFGTYWATSGNLQRSEIFMDFRSSNILLFSVSAFLVLIHTASIHPLGTQSSRLAKTIGWLSANSLGIYVMHPLIFALVWSGYLGAWAKGESWPVLTGVGFHAILAIAVCGCATSILRSIIWLRPLVP